MSTGVSPWPGTAPGADPAGARRSPNAAPEIVAEGFGWTYRGRSRPSLAGCTFRVPPGRVLLVMGPSGGGKTTLTRALTGLIPHELPGSWTGTLRVGELDVAATPAQVVSGEAGIVFQDPESQLVMPRVEDEVAFGLENRGWDRAAMRRRVPEVLETVGLAGFERRSSAGLSGGEQQRLAIADVLAPMPGLLVLDEPTANLDPPGMERVFERLAALAATRERTMVIVEHRLEAALPLADLVLVLDTAGRQLAFGVPDEVASRHVDALERMGSWIPRAWNGRSVSDDGSAARAASPAEVARARELARAEAPAPVRAWAPAEALAPAGEPAPPGAWAPAGEAAPGGAPAPPVGPATTPAADRVPAAVRAQPTHPVLAIEGVTLRYPRGTADGSRAALLDVSVQLRAGERVALLGPNGSGKSTLLFAAAGLRRLDTGRVRVGDGTRPPDEDPARLPARRLARLLGLVFQNPELGFVGRTCAGEVAASLEALGDTPDPGDPRVRSALEAFGLELLADEDPFRISEGEQRRLGIVAVGIARPPILLLDEPTFALDRRGAGAVVTLLDELRVEGQAQLMATHDPRLVPACDRVVALDAGRVVFDGPPSAFLADPPYRPAAPWRDTGSTAHPPAGSASRPAPSAATGSGASREGRPA